MTPPQDVGLSFLEECFWNVMICHWKSSSLHFEVTASERLAQQRSLISQKTNTTVRIATLTSDAVFSVPQNYGICSYNVILTT